MSGVFADSSLARMTVAEGARDGVLWDLLGRVHHRDIARSPSTSSCAATRRPGPVAAGGPPRAASSAPLKEPDEGMGSVSVFLDWRAAARDRHLDRARRLSQAFGVHPRKRRHARDSSRQEQGYLSNLVLAQRGKLSKMRAAFDDDPKLATLALCLLEISTAAGGR